MIYNDFWICNDFQSFNISKLQGFKIAILGPTNAGKSSLLNYLANRDAEWMRPVYEFLGLTIGVVISNQDINEKKEIHL